MWCKVCGKQKATNEFYPYCSHECRADAVAFLEHERAIEREFLSEWWAVEVNHLPRVRSFKHNPA